MRIVKVLAVNEREIEHIERQILFTKDQFSNDSPMSAMLNEALTKVLQAKNLNRSDKQKFQESYRYVVESNMKLAGDEL